MGLFSFVKNAGKSLFGGKAEAAEPDAEVLKKELDDLGLETKGADISIAGDKVVVKGGDLSAEEREKVILAVGNVEGVAEVEDEDDAVQPTFHTVEKGDTLWAISAKTLGNGAHYEKIFEANKPMLTHPDKIYPGQVLRIPTA